MKNGKTDRFLSDASHQRVEILKEYKARKITSAEAIRALKEIEKVEIRQRRTEKKGGKK